VITQRYGDLEIGYSTSWSETDGAFVCAHIVPPSGWYVLGSVCAPNKGKPWAEYGGLVLKDRSASGDLLKPPADYQLRYDPGPNHAYKIWRPVPPTGYVALGDVFWKGKQKPGAETRIACVKKTHAGRDYVRRAELGRQPISSGAPVVLAAYWAITPPIYPDSDTQHRLLLPAGTFSFGTSEPHAPDEVAWMLDLPALVQEDDELPELQLTSYDRPADYAVITDRVVTVPYVMVNDPDRQETWKVNSSPFYKIMRKRHYSLVRFVDYRGSGNGTITEEIEEGVTEETSEEFSQTTGITVGVTVGVEASAKPFGMGASTKVETSVSTSIELGYSRRYGVQTFRSRKVSVSYDVPAGHAGALWSDTHELQPVRGDGTLVSRISLSLHSGSYTGRTYPHTADVPPRVVPVATNGQLEAAKQLGVEPEQLMRDLADTEAPAAPFTGS
jgi:hypothetical protein